MLEAALLQPISMKNTTTDQREGAEKVQPYQFDPELDPEGEAPEEIQTLWLQQDVSEWLVCLYNVSFFYVLLQLLPCSQ